MSLERGTSEGPEMRRGPRVDAIVRVHRAMERAEKGHPLFPGEEAENQAAMVELEERLRRLKQRGVEFADIELSVYARQLLGGAGRITLAS